ncbi:MAG: ABC transporter permease [Candidatus Thermoplasmatota archaeon]|nr:ABC transporter permease [Candidatus Thermoplasmatota archaeon]
MDMRTYIVRKLIYLVITFFAIIIFNFFLFRVLPGDPARAFIGRGISEDVAFLIRDRFHLNDPWYVQLYYYMADTLRLDFGVTGSLNAGTSIGYLLEPRIVNTLILVGIGTILAIYFGVLLGRFAAWRRGRPADTIGMAFALTFYSMPTFLFALVLLLVFGGMLQWFPTRGAYGSLPWTDIPPDYRFMDLFEKLVSRGYHLVLPLLAFTLEIMAEFALIMRNSLTDVLTEDYITTARAKGLSNKMVLKNHAMRNAMLPVVTVTAISIGWVLGGTIMVEMVFSYEGLGKLTWDAVGARDLPLLQALFLIMAVAVLIANLIADIVYTMLDPRVKI